jgi:hypothetical protein
LTRPLRIGFVGAERAPIEVEGVAELASRLAGRGHAIELVPRRAPRFSRLAGLRIYEDGLETAPWIVSDLARHPIEVAHALDPAAGWAAAKALRLGGPPYVLSLHRVVDRVHLVSRRRRIEMLREAAAGATIVLVASERVGEPLARYAIATPRVVREWTDPADCENLYYEVLS